MTQHDPVTVGNPSEPTGSVPSDRLERIPVLTRSHRTWLVVLGLLLFFDFADLNTFAYAAPAIREEWGLSVGDVGLITAASFLGMFVGSVAGGRLADRFGRKRVMVAATLFYSLSSLASAVAVGVVDLAVYRVLTGVGLQAATVVLLTYISEMFPRRTRGRVQALVLAFSLLGIPAMAGFARWVVPHGDGSWRWIFVLGATGIVAAVVALRILPESVRWTAANGRGAESESLIARLEEETRRRTGADLPPVEPQPAPLPATPREVFRAPFGRRLVVLSGYLVLAVSMFYGFNAWLPTLLVENGFTTAQSLTFSSIVSIAACPGALLAMLFIDRIERRTAMLLVNIALAVLLVTFAVVDSYAVLLVCGFLIVLFMQAGVACTYAYLPEIFPTRLRAFGAGIGNGAGRLATFASTFLIASLLTGLGSSTVFAGLAAAAILAGLVIGLFGERTRNRSLEVISEDVPGAAREQLP
ncbi:MFS transporter [Pseudonocardia sp. CA-107938]|uniref:MFS transporter n=1 Tax=Pseudonocardia sp. CA-107938 TaxID=3240021 RepID=UPI003D921E41